jgi:hypothetical protein
MYSSDNRPYSDSYYRRLSRPQALLALLFCVALVSAIIDLPDILPPMLFTRFHTLPVICFAVLLGILTLARIAAAIGERLPSRVIFLHLSLAITCAALITSRFSHFEGRVVRMPGSPFNGFISEYKMDSLYTTVGRQVPNLGFNIKRIQPVTSPDSSRLKDVKVDVTYMSETSKLIRDASFGWLSPLFTAGTFITATDFGYAVRFSLTDLAGNPKDSDFHYLKLFPAGTEDYFEPFSFGYLIHLGLYPDPVMTPQGTFRTQSTELNNPVFKVRIARHKDIIFNDLMGLSDKVRFDSVIFQLHDPAMWVEVKLFKDGGVYVLPFAALSLILSAFLYVRDSRRHRQARQAER